MSFVAGAYSENGSFAVIFASAVLYILICLREKKINFLLSGDLLLAVLGYAFLVSAPASGGRMNLDISAIASNIRNILIFVQERLLPLYVAYALLLVMCIKRGNVCRQKMILSAVLIVSGMGGLAAFSFAAYFALRHACFTAVVTVIACLLLLDGYLASGGKELILSMAVVALAVCFMVSFARALLDVGVVYKKSLERKAAVEEAMSSGSSYVSFEIYGPSTEYSAAFGFYDMATEPDSWPNSDMAKYYGVDAVYGYHADGETPQ